MATAAAKPVLFLAFANDRDDRARYLRNLPEERRRIRESLEDAEDAGLCEVIRTANATLDVIFDTFQDPDYRDRIAVFHYGGHASGYRLLLESEEGHHAFAHAEGLAKFLGQQRGLQLVFLNGCSTQPQVEGLLRANVPAVIATSESIEDTMAMELSARFYAGLGGGASIETAYNEAVAAVQTRRGSNPEDFYRRTRDMGVAEEHAGRWPWAMYVKEGAEIIKAWSLPQATGDPLFGLPPLPTRDLPPSPFRHLRWFTRDEAALFFGRGREIRALYERVTAPEGTPILLLYGQSGVGKSSLLDAGLLPRLEEAHQVRYLRRDAQAGLRGTLASRFETTGDDDALLAAWRAIEKEAARPVVVVLDQVEEVFTRQHPEHAARELDAFLQTVQALFNDPDRRPQGKLILSFRKEWLSEIESAFETARLFYARFFLQRLDRDGTIEAIEGVARTPRLQQHYNLTIDDGLAEVIADDLLEDLDSPLAPTLQILLTKMWDEVKNAERRCDVPLYQSLKQRGILLADFLDEQLATLRAAHPDAVDSGLVLDLLARHTTPLGTAQTCLVASLKQAYAHQNEQLPALVQQCKDLFLLVEAERAGEAAATHLAHDTLALLIRRRFRASDKPGQRALRILENRIVEWKDGQTGTPMDEADLATVEAGASGMPVWNTDEQRLVEASRRARDRRLRLRRFAQMGAVAAVVLILVSAGVAWWLLGESQAREAESLSRALAARAATYRDEGRADLALLLSMEAHRQRETFEARSSLLAAVQANPRLSRFLSRHRAGVSEVAFSPDGTRLASSSHDSTIILWDTHTGQPLRPPFRGHRRGLNTLAFSPNGARLASGSSDSTIILWDVGAGQPVGEPLPHAWAVLGLAFSPDGARLAARGADNTLVLWDVNTRQRVSEPLRGHRAQLYSLAFSPDGTRLASGSGDSTIIVWDSATLQPIGAPLPHPEVVTSLTFAPDGARLVTGLLNGLIVVWDAETGQPLGEPLTSDQTNTVISLAFSPDGARLASGGTDETVRIWDVETRQPMGEPLVGHHSVVTSLSFNNDGTRLASSSGDGTIILWNVETRSPLRQPLTGPLTATSTIAFSPDGTRLASANLEGTVSLWDVAAGQPLGEPLAAHQNTVESVAFSPDGTRLASGSYDNTIIVWDVETRQPIGEPLVGHQNVVTGLAFSPDGARLASSSHDSTLIVWDVAAGQPLGEPMRAHNVELSSVAFSPDGTRLASGGQGLVLWDAATGQPLDTLRSLQRIAFSVAFSPDGTRLASGGDGIILWDLDAEPPVGEPLTGHQNLVTSVAFSPDGAHLISGSTDQTLILWDVETRQPLGEPFAGHQAWVMSVAFSPDGQRVASGGFEETIYLWDLSLASRQEHVCAVANRNLTAQEWTQFMGDRPYRCTCPTHPPGHGTGLNACPER